MNLPFKQLVVPSPLPAAPPEPLRCRTLRCTGALGAQPGGQLDAQGQLWSRGQQGGGRGQPLPLTSPAQWGPPHPLSLLPAQPWLSGVPGLRWHLAPLLQRICCPPTCLTTWLAEHLSKNCRPPGTSQEVAPAILPMRPHGPSAIERAWHRLSAGTGSKL